MRLVDRKTRKPIRIGDNVTTLRGETGVVTGFMEPKHVGSTGRVFLKMDNRNFDNSFFPGVIGAIWDAEGRESQGNE